MKGKTAFQVVKQIQAILSGHEWGSDTASAIADVLRENGIEVLDVEEFDNDN